ncbi:MAG: IPExxxVDY family protein [Chitinophagales bacterium]|nr:IPExxxVDY family protein [Chitinophagales bacterium]
MPAKKTFRLSPSEPEPDLLVFGMATAVRDYQLAFLLNQTLPADFVRQTEIEVELPRQMQRIAFTWFRFSDEDLQLNCFLVTNKSGNEFFIPEYRQADFLLCVQGPEAPFRRSELIRQLKSLQALQLVFEIDIRRIKFKDRLIFE